MLILICCLVKLSLDVICICFSTLSSNGFLKCRDKCNCKVSYENNDLNWPEGMIFGKEMRLCSCYAFSAYPTTCTLFLRKARKIDF